MSNYRVKHFENLVEYLDEEVNGFIRENKIEVLKYTLIPPAMETLPLFIGVLEYEELDHET